VIRRRSPSAGRSATTAPASARARSGPIPCWCPPIASSATPTTRSSPVISTPARWPSATVTRVPRPSCCRRTSRGDTTFSCAATPPTRSSRTAWRSIMPPRRRASSTSCASPMPTWWSARPVCRLPPARVAASTSRGRSATPASVRRTSPAGTTKWCSPRMRRARRWSPCSVPSPTSAYSLPAAVTAARRKLRFPTDCRATTTCACAPPVPSSSSTPTTTAASPDRWRSFCRTRRTCR